jgi:hypothetical protein
MSHGGAGIKSEPLEINGIAMQQNATWRARKKGLAEAKPLI